jgi:hypothetical protein
MKVDLYRFPRFWAEFMARARISYRFEYLNKIALTTELLRNEYGLKSVKIDPRSKVGVINVTEEEFIWFNLRWT